MLLRIGQLLLIKIKVVVPKILVLMLDASERFLRVIEKESDRTLLHSPLGVSKCSITKLGLN